MRHRVDAVAATASVRATSRHRRDRGPSDTPRRPRRGPNRFIEGPETTQRLLRWRRVASTASEGEGTPYRTPLEPPHVDAIHPHMLPGILVLVEDFETTSRALLGGLDLRFQRFPFPP